MEHDITSSLRTRERESWARDPRSVFFSAEGEASMAKKAKHVVCTHCRLGQERVLKQSFLGFYKFACEECQAENTYPLSTGYAVIYGLAIAFAVITGVRGEFRCGILAIGGVFALAFDFGIRRRAKEAQQNERSKGQVVADVFK